MPAQPPAPCPRCHRLAYRAGRCGVCGYNRHDRHARGYGNDWLAISRAVIAAAGGRCQLRRPGCTGAATTTDHVTPRAQGGTDEPSNLQAACRACNSGKRDR